MLPRVLAAVMAAAARRPLVVALAVGLLALAGAAAALRLQPTSATETLIGRSTDSYAASQRFHKQFGDDSVYVLIREPVAKLVLTNDIIKPVGLEGCLSGRIPTGVTPKGGPNGPCGQLGRFRPAQIVFGPGTFINEAVTQIQGEMQRQFASLSQQAAAARSAAEALARKKGYSAAQAKAAGDAAEQLVTQQFYRTLAQVALKYQITSIPQLNDRAFVSRLVFDETKAPGTPKAKFAYIFPTKDSALIQVRLRPNLSERERERAIDLIREAAAMPDWRLTEGGGTYVVTGAPVVVRDLSSSISSSLRTLLIGALLVMAATLALVFRARRRLLPLLIAVAAASLTFGLLSLSGASLTMASVGVIPVLLGLAVDYAIQLQSRWNEAGREPDAVRRAARVGRVAAPTVATAAAATAAGFAVLVLSPVPMVRGFGILLVIGIALALVCALTLGTAILATPGPRRPPPAAVLAVGDALGAAARGAGEILTGNPVARAGTRGGRRAWTAALGAATRDPRRVLAIGAVLAVAGWALDTQAKVESDVTKLVPQDLGALRDLRALEDATGIGGEIDVVVRSDNLATPAVLKWMSGYQARLLKHYDYSSDRGCGKAELCPAFSLPDLFSAGGAKSQAQINALLDAVPAYFSQGVLTRDRRTATLAFGIRLMPLDRQKHVIDTMRAELHTPPGVHAELAGLPVLAAEANARIASPWRRFLLLLAGLVAVAAVLLVAFRDARRALIPLVPIVLATGWSALLLAALRIELNPMSVTLGALVIAISTEFSVLLAERYRSERLDGLDPRPALQRAYASTGAAVIASGTTAIAGFAVLALADIRMLRDFGLVTVVDLAVSLLGVLIVLPGVLLLAEGVIPDRPRRAVPRPRLRRRAEAAG